jgi:dienelactone hydrolase
LRLLLARWTSVLILLLGCAGSPRAPRDPLTGSWRGRAVFRGASLDFDVRFSGRGQALRGTMSAPDLMLLDQPLDAVRYRAPHVDFGTPDEHPIRFDGTLEGDSIRGGAFVPHVPGIVEAGGSLRFVLRRVPPPAPPPYTTEEVRIDAPGARLAGTIFIPSSRRRSLPGIVILQGSSTNLRREYVFYADHFARMGLVVLTFDKRGTGESTGDYGAATYDDLAADAAAAVALLRRRPEVAADRVGVWGLSQGAFIAPLVAARVPSLRFIVAVSPPGVTIGTSAAYQDSVRLITNGFSPADAGRAAALDRRIATWLGDGADEAALARDLARFADAPWRRASTIPARLPAGPALSGWYWRGRTTDPIPSWRRLRVPALVVFGAADELLPARVSAEKIEDALRAGGNRDATVSVFPGADHVLRRHPPVTGVAWDWPRAAPGYLDLITRWITRHVESR